MTEGNSAAAGDDDDFNAHEDVGVKCHHQLIIIIII